MKKVVGQIPNLKVLLGSRGRGWSDFLRNKVLLGTRRREDLERDISEQTDVWEGERHEGNPG